MPATIPLLTEGLPIRRLGIVTRATATIWRDDNDPYAVDKPEFHLVPVIFPAEVPMEGGWLLQHASPTTGQVVTENALLELFHSPDHDNICLNTNNLYNTGLLESIAAAFTDKPSAGLKYGSLYTAEGTPLLPGNSPTLTYYRPVEAPEEQYLLLYTNRFAPGERATEVPSYVSLYALVQVELDEARFIFLLRQARDAASAARRQR